jgi:hypothetical protein
MNPGTEILPADNNGQTEAEKIAQSIVPYPRDDARAKYLGLRCSGFTVREALRLIGFSHSALSKWRKDTEFESLERRTSEFRKELSQEYAKIEFMRNYRLVLEKDYRVLQKSLEVGKDGESVPLSEDNMEYLKKLRTHYTPQQLQIMETLVSAGDVGSFDFTELALSLSRTTDKVTVVGKRSQPSTVLGGDVSGETTSYCSSESSITKELS